MNIKIVNILLLLAFSGSCFGIPLDTPSTKAPALTADDIAWATGKIYVKGLLPDISGYRVSTVKLEFVTVDGDRRTLVGEQDVDFASNRASHWQGISGELLIMLEEEKGKTKIFMGIATPKQSIQIRLVEDLGDAVLPAVVSNFDGTTGNTTDDLRYTVPVGESEIFKFYDDGEHYGSLVVIAENEKNKQ